MDQTREQLEKPPATATGIAADMKRLKSDSASTAEEVREFIANLKGRSPQEVLGAVSESGLVQATVQATFGCLIVLLVATVVPWWFDDGLTNDERAAVVMTAEMVAESASAEAEVATDSTSESTEDSSSSDTPTDNDAARAAAAMKIDETVVTDPKSNPLDGNLDKLLDGLD